MSPSEGARLEILHDHYKDTFTHLRSYLKLRDRLFLLVLAVLILMLFQIFAPAEAGEAISQVVVNQLRLTTPVDISFIGSIIWFSLFGLIVKYLQTSTLIERQYDYIHQLEKQISSYFNDKVFTREGKSYLENYPLYLNWAWLLYTVIFPLLLLTIVVIKILGELPFSSPVPLLPLINAMVAILIVVSTLSHFIPFHSQKRKQAHGSKSKKH